jgi:hypothetical protein
LTFEVTHEKFRRSSSGGRRLVMIGGLQIMRALILAATVSIMILCVSATAQTSASSSQSTAHYTTGDTDLGTLLDDPAARKIIDKYLPGFTANDQIEMARSLTLKGLQQYAPDTISDQALAEIDADFAKLPIKQ